jgi:hypothetical protein
MCETLCTKEQTLWAAQWPWFFEESNRDGMSPIHVMFVSVRASRTSRSLFLGLLGVSAEAAAQGPCLF